MMNYFMSLTILTVVVTFLSNLSHGIIQKFPGKYIKRIGCSEKFDVYKPNANGEWPSEVRNITFDISIPNERLLLTVKWIANTANTNGFKIILKSIYMSDICIICDYTDTVKNYPPGLYSFSVTYKMDDMKRYRNFTGLLFPLPNRNNASQAVAFNTNISIDCSRYPVYFEHAYTGRDLNVTLFRASDECRFKQYKIALFTLDHNDNLDKDISSKIFSFKGNEDKLKATLKLNICKGKYAVQVVPHDPNWNNYLCLCKDRKKLCRRCMASVTRPLHLVPAKKCKKKAKKCIVYAPSSKSSVYISELYLFQFFLGLSLLFLLILAILYWKSNFLARNRGIVFFLDDHEPHTNAVTKLVQYLNECHLRVSLASAFLQNPDIPNQLVVMTEALKSDFILLVLSNALQKRMEAWDKQQDYVEFFKEVNSNILTKQFLELLMASNKLHVCKFDHVDGFGHWPKPCYSLPTDLTKMTTDLMGRSCCRNLCKFWKSRTLSVELYKAIQEAFLYEQSHKNWLEEKYRDRKTL